MLRLLTVRLRTASLIEFWIGKQIVIALHGNQLVFETVTFKV